MVARNPKADYIPGVNRNVFEGEKPMADQVTVQGENTPEYVAYRLMEKIFNAENKSLDNLSREEILSTYKECIRTVRVDLFGA